MVSKTPTAPSPIMFADSGDMMFTSGSKSKCARKSSTMQMWNTTRKTHSRGWYFLMEGMDSVSQIEANIPPVFQSSESLSSGKILRVGGRGDARRIPTIFTTIQKMDQAIARYTIGTMMK